MIYEDENELYWFVTIGSRICARSSAQTEQQSVTNWWPVALIGLTAGLIKNWSKTKTTGLRNPHGAILEVSSFQLRQTKKTCSKNVRLRSQFEKSNGVDALPANGTKQRVFLAFHDLLCLFISAPVDMSPPPKLATGNSTGPELQKSWESTHILPNAKTNLTNNWLMIHGSIPCSVCTLLTWCGTSHLDSKPETIRNTRITNCWKAAGPSNELNLKTQ